MGGGGGGKGGGGSRSQLIGYRYYLGMHICLVHDIDEIKKIAVGEKLAWEGSVKDGQIYIDAPELHGGEQREGGVQGYVDVMSGQKTQGVNDYLASLLGSWIPAFRGVVSVVLRHVYVAAMNPYIKPWKFLVRKTSSTWYPSKCAIGYDANPAHIIYACLTNTEWGLGYDPGTIDDASFTAVADQLYAEDFGLSMIWSAQDPVDDFIADINRHIDGLLYTHPRTGLWTLKLLRGDYDPATVPVFGPTEIKEIKSFSRLGYAERANQLTLKYREVDGDGVTSGEVERSITLRNPAARAAQGQVIAETVEYPGITNGTLASKIATRDLRQRSAALCKATIAGKRELTKALPGDVFKLVWPEYGIEGIFMRVVEIDYGTPQDREVTIEAIEDYFGTNQAVIAAPTSTGWTNPISEPYPCEEAVLFEVPYYVLVQAIIGDIPAIQDAYDPKGGVVGILALKPTPDSLGYNIYRQSGASFTKTSEGAWTPVASLASAVSKTAVTFTFAAGAGLGAVQTGTLAYVENEIVLITAVGASSFTVERGMLDTVPDNHALGARIWAPSKLYIGYEGTELLENESATLRLATVTGLGELALNQSADYAITMHARAYRPYPPGNFRINGSYLPTVANGELSFTWAHRDRKQQTAGEFVKQSDGNVGPEAGTTYTLRLYDETDVLRKTVAGIVGTGYTWDTEQADCGLSVIQLVSTTAISATTSSGPQITIPASTQVGDLLLLTLCGTTGSNTPPPTPSGWTLVATSNANVINVGYFLGMRVFSRIAQAGDPGATLTLSFNANLPNRAALQVYRHPSGVVVESNTTNWSGAATTSPTMPIKTITGTATGHIAIAAACMYLPGNTTSPATLTPTGFTLDTPATANGNALAVGHKLVGLGASLSGSVTTSIAAGNNGWVNISLLLKAATGTPKLWNTSVRAELEAVRDGYTSLQKWNHTITRT